MTDPKIVRAAVIELDDLLGIPFRVLDDGFVRLIDYMGSDESIVQAARISYGKGTRKVSEDRALIRYLMRHRHTTPFEMCEIKLHVRVPMDCWRQWIRHRTANVNEYSTRYSIAIDATQRTSPDAWRRQSQQGKQGSEGLLPVEIGELLTQEEAELHAHGRSVYDKRISSDVAREQARKDLSLSTYTEAYWKIDLHNLLHFLDLRMDDHAQHEIRSYATLIGEDIVSKWCPLAWEAFLDYRRNALILSRLELDIVKALASGNEELASQIAQSGGLIPISPAKLGRNREREELELKLRRLNLEAPWH
ncbi:MAG: FAD-dependent thymidylate synthase [Pyrinomonadaceae bacterium]